MRGRAQNQEDQERVRWSPDEDKKLAEYMERHGETGSWKNVPTLAGLNREPKACRQRWYSNVKPGINQKPFSEEEKATIIELQKQHGNEWETIAQEMSGRTATKIKNFWNSHQRNNPQVCPRNPDGIGIELASIPNASSIPAPVSASLEPSKADQVVEIVEVTPADQEIANRYPSTSTTFEHCDDLGSEGIPVDILFNWSPPDTSVDSIFN
ncbi:transcription factor MYB92-like [Vitis riparia]|uniref:transcription factor MYB92-like n=1 Tax=Vitis riparia TaxID=96939 RepID=UPI00155AF6BD|nr:transcription factor MYB92-like [Vitis riparia]